VALLLVSGLPGAGKSTYCEWLAQVHDYIHWETDAHLAEWDQLIMAGPNLQTATAARTAMRGLGKDVVVEWGFLPKFLPLVRLMGQVGFDLWWFGGNEVAARQSWQKRSIRLDDRLFDGQLASIQAAWPRIEPVYRGHTIDTVSPGPTHMDNVEIYRHMFG
jgi:hypothetical protein